MSNHQFYNQDYSVIHVQRQGSWSITTTNSESMCITCPDACKPQCLHVFMVCNLAVLLWAYFVISKWYL